MTVVLIGRDLLFGSRIAGAAVLAQVELLRVEDPAGLPSPSSVRLVLVDWAERRPEWADQLREWCADAPESVRPRLLLFGPHTDLAAHADARSAGLGPMLARSKLLTDLPSLLVAAR